MKAAFFAGDYKVELIEKPIPDIGVDEVLVKVAYCGLCGSEKRILESGFDQCTPGHEISGTIAKLGDNVQGFTENEAVFIYLSNFCGKCDACQVGNTSQCSGRLGLVGWSFDGGYAQYVKVPKHMVFSLGDISLPLGVLALDTVGTAFHGLRLGDIQPEWSVMVIGCGPIGLGCVNILKNHYKVRKLYAADTSQKHLEFAKDMGAETLLVDPADTPGSLEAQLGEQLDCIVEVVGIDPTVMAAVQLVKPGGKVVFIGEPEKALHLTRNAKWVLKDFSFINSWYFPVREIEGNLEYIRKYPDEVAKLGTHTFPFDQMNEAYHAFMNGETGKVLIQM